MQQKMKVKKSRKSMQADLVHQSKLARRTASRTSRRLPTNDPHVSHGMSPVATWPVGMEAVMVCFTPTLPTIR